MVKNMAILRLFLRNLLAILAINLNKIGYFWASAVGNTALFVSRQGWDADASRKISVVKIVARQD